MGQVKGQEDWLVSGFTLSCLYTRQHWTYWELRGDSVHLQCTDVVGGVCVCTCLIAGRSVGKVTIEQRFPACGDRRQIVR